MTELEKLDQARHNGSQEQGEFLEWLQERGIVLMSWYTWEEDGSSHSDWRNHHRSHQELLADFHGIDLVKLEQEKREMLEKIRAEYEKE